ncbi:MAG: methyltransferase, partial [Mesorhizobium sp.]|nr:methyltransferase [Mesorhizobium sp.]
MLLLDIVVVVVGWAMVASYVWSTKHHFSADHFPLGAKLVSAAVIGCALALSWTTLTAEQPVWFTLAGLALQLLSAGLFWWAIAASRAASLRFAFDPSKPAGILTDGPYRMVRHPFYTSYLLFWTGWAVVSASPSSAAIIAFFAFAYAAAAIEEEQDFASSALAEDYGRYRAVTGR